MKTIKFLRLAVLLQIVFYFICAASILYLYYGYFGIGHFLLSLWMLNPVAPICCVIGLITAHTERKDSHSRAIIGKKWIWFILLFLITTCVYLISAVLLVSITGGV